MMMEIDRLHRSVMDATVQSFGMYRGQHIMLMHLAKEGKSPSQKDLAKHFGITPAAMTGVLKRLERDGYILRTLGADNRYNEISITEKGMDIVRKTRAIFRKTEDSFFDGFSTGELDTYLDAMRKIRENMEKHRKVSAEKENAKA